MPLPTVSHVVSTLARSSEVLKEMVGGGCVGAVWACAERCTVDVGRRNESSNPMRLLSIIAVPPVHDQVHRHSRPHTPGLLILGQVVGAACVRVPVGYLSWSEAFVVVRSGLRFKSRLVL